MSRWKELPASLDQQTWQLAVQLRRLKDRAGLSLSALAAKTTFSKSSWERYLNGRTLPPRSAVEELATACGADPERLLALHEVAEAEWRASAARREDGPGEVPEEPAPETGPPATAVASRRSPLWPVLGGLCCALVGGVVGALLVSAPWEGGGTDAGGTARAVSAGASAGAFTYGRTYHCHFERRGGTLYAGHSTDHKSVIGLNVQGWQVVEAQCLLQHAGFSPGRIDGSFGPDTEIAVKRFQHKKGLDVDGLVGPRTWGALGR
ncbi:helix-turn-helix domain-containing protein [Streptomyces sediminimaris]|uniref:helix-turn-helix domain-containing protein n=1 Tax=Streptomyces sediminimaris TaxID=3383721 RepID=UPI0039995FF5